MAFRFVSYWVDIVPLKILRISPVSKRGRVISLVGAVTSFPWNRLANN